MLIAPHSRYQRVGIAAWDCRSAAGDAAATWRACAGQVSALRLDPSFGWCGSIGAAPGATPLIAAALAAARRPWRALGELPGSLALAVATSKGDPTGLDRALGGAPAELFPALPGLLNAQVAQRLAVGSHLPCPVAAACSTGLYALLEAADHIEAGRCARALAGAADCSLTPLMHAGFSALDVLCGERRPQAFAAANGFALAEGAGIVALAAEGPWRFPWRLAGGVRLGDAGHPTRFVDPRTLLGALAALWRILPAPELIVTHGTGTATGDAYERAALDHGPWAGCPRLNCKPIIGHCLGASAAVEVALALEAPVQRLWKLSLGFGGHLAAVAVARS